MRQIVDKISAILGLYTFERSDWGVSEISRKLGMPKSTVSELLSSLVAHGFLERSPKARFGLGWRFFNLNQILYQSTPLVQHSSRAMNDLIERYGESSQLIILDNHEAVAVENVQAIAALVVLLARIGQRVPAYASAGGKLLLAQQEWSVTKAALEPIERKAFTSATLINIESLRKELDLIRARGYAIDREERMPGLSCIAAPIRNHEGKVVAAISLSLLTYRFAANEAQFVTMALEAGKKISANLGYDVRNHL